MGRIAGVVLLAVCVARAVLGTASSATVEQPVSTLDHKAVVGGRSNWLIVTISALGLVAVFALFVGGYRGMSAALANPDLPSWRPSALVFFERPDIDAALQVRVTEESGRTEYDYLISVENVTEGDSLGFHLLLTERAQSGLAFPNGQPLPLRDGCPEINVFGLAERLECDLGPLFDDRVLPLAAKVETAQIISGKILGSNYPGAFTTVTVYSDDPVSQSAGPRTFFSLPQIGTAYLPTDGRSSIGYTLREGGPRVWVPAEMSIVVDYGALSINEFLESVAPTPVDSGVLAWSTDSRSSVQPRGSIQNKTIDSRNQWYLFLAGSAVGVGASLIPLLLASLIRGLRPDRPLTG